jgi:hypothetical protein
MAQDMPPAAAGARRARSAAGATRAHRALTGAAGEERAPAARRRTGAGAAPGAGA